MSRLSCMLLVAVACTALSAPIAIAKDYCVDRSGTCDGGSFAGATGLQAALTAASSTSDPDRVLIGPGTYSRTAGFAYNSVSPVDVEGSGSGPGGTALDAGSATGVRVLQVVNSTAGRVGGLAIVMPATDSNIGLDIGGVADGVAVTAPAGATNSTGINLSPVNAMVENSLIALPTDLAASTIGIYSGGSPASVTVRDTTATAANGMSLTSASVTVQRVHAAGTVRALSVATGSSDGNARVDDSVLRVLGGTFSAGLYVNNNAGVNETVNASNLTIAGDGAANEIGVWASSITSNRATVIYLANALIRGTSTALRAETQTGTPTAAAYLYPVYSDFDATTDDTSHGPGTNSISTSSTNRDGTQDPKFVATTGADAYKLRFDSPLVDAGDPSGLAGGESATDLLGLPRIVAGHGSGEARRDIGAFEYQRTAPTAPTTSASPNPAQTGQQVTFAASGSTDADAGETVSYSWAFDDGSAAAAGASVQHAFATAGVHTATVTVTDSAGVATTKQQTVTVAAPSGGGGGGGGGGGTAAPLVLSKLAVTPASFVAALSGPSTVAARAGGVVSFTLSRAAKVTFTVKHLASGVKRGTKCVAPGRHPGHAKRCRRLVGVTGSFSTAGRAGTNAVRFTGRLNGRTLAPGSYELVAKARDASGAAGAGATTKFKVLPRR